MILSCASLTRVAGAAGESEGYLVAGKGSSKGVAGTGNTFGPYDAAH